MATANDQDTHMDDAPAAADVPDASEPADAPDTLLLSPDEERVLALYDRLRTLQLEIALFRARQSYTDPPNPPSVDTAQKQLLEARAAYVLRNEVVDSVLSVNPVLRAVHRATHASPVERDLLPAVEQRDATAQTVAQNASARQTLQAQRVTVSAESRRLTQQNVALAAQVRELAAQTEAEAAAAAEAEAPSDASQDALDELSQLEAAVKTSRQRWKLIKGAASAVVVGSGVDWARDAALRDIVLDPE